MDCCKNELGLFAHNKEINTGIEADQTGMFELLFTSPGFSRFSKYYHFETGQNIVIPAGVLNEDFTYKMVISKPDGEALLVEECPNFIIKTFVNIVACDDIQYL